jgi:hypothetical protein
MNIKELMNNYQVENKFKTYDDKDKRQKEFIKLTTLNHYLFINKNIENLEKKKQQQQKAYLKRKEFLTEEGLKQKQRAYYLKRKEKIKQLTEDEQKRIKQINTQKKRDYLQNKKLLKQINDIILN